MSAVTETGPAAPARSSASPRRSSGTARWVTTKVLGSLASLVFVIVFNFFLFRVLGGDPAKGLARNKGLDAEAIERLRELYGVGKPLGEQFLSYLAGLLRGDLGISWKFNAPVSEVIASRMWPTLVFVGTAVLLSAVIGTWMGIRQGWRPGGRFDRMATGSTLTLYAMPEFWLGLILILVFSVGVGPFPGLFPTGGLNSPNPPEGALGSVLDVAWHLVLPVTALTLVYLAEYSLVMRASLIEERSEDYLKTARAKGLRDDLVRRRHAVPNALIPTFTLVLLNVGFVVSGAITLETVFSIPGLGLLSYEALKVPDYPLLQGIFLLFSAAVILTNLIGDLALGKLDPRVSRS